MLGKKKKKKDQNTDVEKFLLAAKIHANPVAPQYDRRFVDYANVNAKQRCKATSINIYMYEQKETARVPTPCSNASYWMF